MKELKELLSQRSTYLKTLITSKRKTVSKNKIEGSVKSIKHGNGYQYYIKYPGETRYSYVKAKDQENVIRIVQQEYDMKVLDVAEREYSKVINLLKIYDKGTVEEVYESMPMGKRKLVVSESVSDEEYLKMWRDRMHTPLGFRENSPEFYSSKGERMRSKSEVIIANLLDKLNVEYKYEMPLKLNRIGIVHPDFTILNVKERKEIYLEHLGMLDDQAYRNNAIMKIRDYENSGYYLGDRLIVTGESLNCPLDVKSVERRIRFILGIN